MNRNDVYKKVAADIFALLKQGVVPWHKTWKDGFQTNLLTGKAYRGINQIVLQAGALRHEYEHPYWVTYKQAQALDGSVRKGEKSLSSVVKWLWYKDKDDDDEDSRVRATPKYYSVFNISQCEGLELPINDKPLLSPLAQCEQIVAEMSQRPRFTAENGRAYYRPLTDTVNVPNLQMFESAEAYYEVIFHELAHSTGHGKRLARKGLLDWESFGTPVYSQEELCAESCAAFLCNMTGLDVTFENSVAYIKSWLKRLKDDPVCLVHGMQQGQAAADYILGYKYEEE